MLLCLFSTAATTSCGCSTSSATASAVTSSLLLCPRGLRLRSYCVKFNLQALLLPHQLLYFGGGLRFLRNVSVRRIVARRFIPAGRTEETIREEEGWVWGE